MAVWPTVFVICQAELDLRVGYTIADLVDD